MQIRLVNKLSIKYPNIEICKGTKHSRKSCGLKEILSKI